MHPRSLPMTNNCYVSCTLRARGCTQGSRQAVQSRLHTCHWSGVSGYESSPSPRAVLSGMASVTEGAADTGWSARSFSTTRRASTSGSMGLSRRRLARADCADV